MTDDDLSSDRRPYRRSGPNQCPSTCDQLHVAVICALPLEADAVHALFDHHWDDDGFPYVKAPGDQNVYSVGAIGRHNVVLTWLPGMGMANSAVVAAGCRSTFPNIRLALIVGICGGVPSTPDGGEIVLGDVIISDGLVLYDFGRQNPEHFVRKDILLDSLARPSPEIRALSAKLKSLRPQKILQSQVAEYLDALQSQPELQAKYPGKDFDKLFEPAYRHVSDGKPCDECCRDEHLEPRVRLQQSAPQPVVHFGLIATGNTVSFYRSISDFGLLINLPELQEYQRSVLHFLYPFGSEFEVQKDRNPERIAGTCEWFINHERFQHWQGTECSSLLWVSADPGRGKSVLAKYLVDSIISKSNSTTCFFFFKDALQGQSEVTDALRCLLYQIFHQKPTLLSNDVAMEIEGVRKSQNFRDL
ncbi:unnamed protein product [Clonostachys chloroleuca]|uniref:Nucleoside phosphorylase domain-containing protein n=1 Tax=Clonostachys chloroleuca TaxID=1926264 RepID=A0AA35LWZ8_9HYPO|nr:unnamed protein product [Clonostachys chloroleuca]